MAELTFEGGLNEQDVSTIDQSECISGYNFELGNQNTHYIPRLPFDHLGKAAYVLSFDGVDDYASIPYNALFDFERTDSFSIIVRALVRSGHGGAILSLVGKQAVTSLRGIRLAIGGLGTLRVGLRNDQASVNRISLGTTTAWDDDNWHTFAFSYNGTSTAAGVLLYVDGVLQAATVEEDSLSATIKSADPFVFGYRGDSAADFLDGDIAETWLYARALTAQEMADLHNGQPVSATNLIGHWVFNTGTGTTIADDSGNTLTASLSGPSWVSDIDSPLNGQSINGFIQLIKNDDTETTLVQSGDTVYLWDGSSIFTSKGTVSSSSRLRGVTWELGGYSVIVDIAKQTVIKKWDGTAFSTLTTGLTPTTLYAKYGVVHLGRMWLFNVKTSTDTPHLLVASAFENPTSYDTSKRAGDSSFSTGNEAFYMVTPDLKPINGVMLFFNTLVISTEKGLLWKLTGTDSTTFVWEPFYAGSSAIGTETLANIGDDGVYMKKDGSIESIRSTQTFGDVKTDDLSRFIFNTVSGLTSCITVYDQTRQKVYFFAGANKLLVLYKFLLGTKLSPWSVYKTNHASSFSTNTAIYMRQPGGSNYFVYFGDDSGNIYQLDGSSVGDAGTTDIQSTRKSAFFQKLEDDYKNIIDPETDSIRGRVYYRRTANCDLLMEFEWADDFSIADCTVPLAGPSTGDGAAYFGGEAYFGGSFYFNGGFQLSQRVSTRGFSPVGRGPGFNLSLTITSGQQFDLMKIQIP